MGDQVLHCSSCVSCKSAGEESVYVWVRAISYKDKFGMGVYGTLGVQEEGRGR